MKKGKHYHCTNGSIIACVCPCQEPKSDAADVSIRILMELFQLIIKISVVLGKNGFLLAGSMLVRKFDRTGIGCSFLWSSESLLGFTKAVPSCDHVKAELICSTH
jgi:hypothetical protein